MFKYVQKIITFLENPQIPFLYSVLLFFSSVTFRNFLEIFSDKARISLKLFPVQQFIYYSAWMGLSISFLHYYLFWTALAMALVIIFHILTKENIKNIFRVVLPSFIMLNITPIFDLLTTSGKGRNISYAHPKNIAELLPLPKDFTAGMICTIVVTLILIFLYCKVKTGRWKNGLLGSLAVYLLLLVLSLLPFILKTSHPIPIIRVLLIAIFIQASIIFYCINRRYFISLVKDIRWLRLLYFYSMFILGIMLMQPSFSPKVVLGNLDSFLLTLISISLCWIVAVIFNNLEDYSADRISNTNRPLTSNSIPQKDYQKIGLALMLLAAVCGLGINFQTFFFALLFMGMSFLYSLPPLKFKRVLIFSKIFISFDSLILVMLGYIFAGGELLKFPSVIIWYFLIFVTLTLNFIDLKDCMGDKQAGIVTLPVWLGLKRAKLVTGGFSLISYSLLSWVFLDLRLFIPTLVLGGAQFFLINKKNYQEKWVLLMHLVSILFLLIYLSLLGTFPKVPG